MGKIKIKMRNLYFWSGLLVMLIVMSSVVSAEIILSQPKSLYNLGEEIKLTAEVSSISEGYFSVDLVCENTHKNVYNSLLTKKQTNIALPLVPLYIGNLSGECYFSAEYGKNLKESQRFEISREIEVNFDIKDRTYQPGESVIAKGSAIKKNNLLVGQDMLGYVEISAGNSNLKYLGVVKDGKFSVNFTIPENMNAGTYPLIATVYEKDEQGEITNTGEVRVDLKIMQQGKKIEVAINKQTISPKDILEFKVFLYDQSNQVIPGEVMVEIKDSAGTERWKRLVQVGESVNVSLGDNPPSGYWDVIATKDELSSKRLFSVEEVELARFEIDNQTLVIKNIGNIIYQRAVQISIGDSVKILDLKLKVGEEKKFSLLAPPGEYNIKISDGTNTLVQERVPLTGSVISVEDVKGKLGLWTRYPIVWLFLIAVMGVFILMMFQRISKKRAVSYPISDRDYERHNSGKVKKEARVLKLLPIKTGTAVKEAEHVLVLKGERQSVSMIGIKIKNTLAKISKESLEKAFGEVYDLKGAVYRAGEYFFIIFSPLLTKSFKNEMQAVKSAVSIQKALEEHNKKFNERIEFGIGVNSGEIINQIEDGKLKFTGLGKTITSIRKIAEISNGEVLIGKELHEKTISSIKTEKHAKEDVFKIKSIVNVDVNKKFIGDFLKKLEEDEKKSKDK